MVGTNYRLEYNQKQGLFNFEDTEKNNKNTFGWIKVCDKLSEAQCIEFTKKMDKKYSSLGSSKKFPTTETIKAEFVEFLLN
jgi:hypothetical protein